MPLLSPLLLDSCWALLVVLHGTNTANMVPVHMAATASVCREQIKKVKSVPNSDPNYFVSLGLKITALFMSFVSGIVAATWAIASKIKGFDDRLVSVELSQKTCQVETLGEIKRSLEKINGKLDNIPDVIDGKLARSHARIDEVILNQGKNNDNSRKD